MAKGEFLPGVFRCEERSIWQVLRSFQWKAGNLKIGSLVRLRDVRYSTHHLLVLLGMRCLLFR